MIDSLLNQAQITLRRILSFAYFRYLSRLKQYHSSLLAQPSGYFFMSKQEMPAKNCSTSSNTCTQKELYSMEGLRRVYLEEKNL
jgi:hypothetical protein